MIWGVSSLTNESEPMQGAALFIKPQSLRSSERFWDFQCIHLNRLATQRWMSLVSRDVGELVRLHCGC